MRISRLLFLGLIFVLVFAVIQPALPAAQPALAQAGTTATTVDQVNVRSIPGLNARILGTFPINTVLTVDGREDQLGNGGIWVYVTPTSGGTTGWVLSDYLAFPAGFDIESLPIVEASGQQSELGTGGTDTVGDGSYTAAAVNFRRGPALNASIIRTLASGTPVDAIGRNNAGTWVKVSVNGEEGWLYATLVYVPNGSSNLPVAEEIANEQTISVPDGGLPGSTLNPVNFRTAPSLSGGIITTLAAGTPVAFTARNGSNTWFKGQVNGQEGWLYYTLVAINGNSSDLPVEGEPPAAGGAPVGGSPGYSSANLRVYSYGAHVANFDHVGLMQYAGMSWAKVQVRYGRGADPGGACGTVNYAHSLGLRILIGLVGHAGDVTAGQSYFNDYANYAAGLAACGADAIEIWNEQNLDREWAAGHLDPYAYTQLLATSYNAIKGVNSGTIVISGALAPTGAEGAFGRDHVWNDNAYLAGMRDAGAYNYMDCLGAHYNEGIISPYATSGDPRGGYYTRYFYGMVGTYYNTIRRPICFTELGYLTPEGYGPLPGSFSWASDTTLAQQAQWVRDVVALGRSDSRVALIIIWNMNFLGYHGNDPMGGYALVRPDGSCPACDRLAGR